MHGRRVYFVIALALICPATLWGEGQSADALSLNQCIKLALERHPLIHSSRQRHEAALARIKQATSYPYPSVSFNSDLQPFLLDFVNSKESYLGVNQTLELPRKRAGRGKIAEQEASEIETDINLVRLEVVFQVRNAFYQLLLSTEQLEYAKRDQELADDYLQKAELKFSAGDVSRVEAVRAKVESLKAANAVRIASKEADLAKARLNYQLAQEKNRPLQVVGRLEAPLADLNLERLQEEALAMRPELKRLQFSVQKELHKQQNAHLSNWPDLDFNASVHYLENEPTTWSFTVAVPLPFLFRQRQNAEIAEAQANIGALQREADQARNTIRVEVEEAYTNAQKARDEIELYQDRIMPQAQEVYDMFLFSYQEGEIGGIELIEARRTLNESRKSYANALFEYNLALTALEKAIGRMP
jgi:outer membrane protein TolC